MTCQNYRPFEWGLRQYRYRIHTDFCVCQNYRPFEWGLRHFIFWGYECCKLSELPSIWMRTTTSSLPFEVISKRCQNYRPFELGLRHDTPMSFSHDVEVRITVHLNEDYDVIRSLYYLFLTGQNYRPFEWGLRLSKGSLWGWNKSASELPSIWMRTTTLIFILSDQIFDVRITVHLNEDYDKWHFDFSYFNLKSELPSIWMRTTTVFSVCTFSYKNSQNYRPFEWGLRQIFQCLLQQ